ncbi:MAG: hypothetical protein PHR28_08175 [candidate division Zixibacteria bacterium]|nr:hypothetical protein [candidate division Zixibacteria bacterium]
MNALLERLQRNQRKGSKPRCHLLTEGSPELVAERLTSLIAPYGLVTVDDHWMPKGFKEVEEAQLHNAPRLLPVDRYRRVLESWWLATANSVSVTPNWDLASTCTIAGKDGLLLIEAKAHLDELKSKDRCVGSERNFERIGEAIGEANRALNVIKDGWRLSHENHYQLCNRFAWSWKLASLGVPVILVYLGFLRANEMQKSLPDEQSWEDAVRKYAQGIVPENVWGGAILVDGVPIFPLIRTLEISLDSIAVPA